MVMMREKEKKKKKERERDDKILEGEKKIGGLRMCVFVECRSRGQEKRGTVRGKKIGAGGGEMKETKTFINERSKIW